MLRAVVQLELSRLRMYGYSSRAHCRRGSRTRTTRSSLERAIVSQRHFVFEASANARDIRGGEELLVSVEPSPARYGGITLDPVVTEFTRGASTMTPHAFTQHQQRQ